ncbi:kinase-like domain-containing protein [Rhizophagus clarus]|uniref:Kinase-like domain-containing protein n=1 Tax=Rhizophagus clarus TaxID=94130 RepID=A0A8H3LJ34_9GLOM|nr:kinase-like domain-containing protein [Rhizophagus clarus]
MTTMNKLNEICVKCNKICFVKRFQKNFENWTSGDSDIDELIQDTQLSAHTDTERILEWIPRNRFHNIKCTVEDEVYKANWIDGHINGWDNENHNWKRKDQNILVVLRSLYLTRYLYGKITIKSIKEIIGCHKLYGITEDPDTNDYMAVLDDRLYDINRIEKDKFRANWIDGCINNWDIIIKNWKRKDQNTFVVMKNFNNLSDIILEFNENVKYYKVYGITQDPETKDYILVWNKICKKCKRECNAFYFLQNLNNWTSGNKVIDKFIQYSQLSTHENTTNALEWIPYDRFYNISYIEKDEFRANWIDGYIDNWDINNKNWKRKDQNTSVIMKNLKNFSNIIKFIENVKYYKVYGITQNPETKNYIMNLNNWTSGNKVIDKFIQSIQLSTHKNTTNVLEWIPYDRFYNISYIEKDEFRANWIDGYIDNWDINNKNWKRKDQNTLVIMKYLKNFSNVIEFIEIVKNFIVTEFIEIVKNLRVTEFIKIVKNLRVTEFIKIIKNSSSVTEFIEIVEYYKVYGITQDPETKDCIMVWNKICKKCKKEYTQLSTHKSISNVLEWIPYNKFYDISYIEKNIFRANWSDGHIKEWNIYNKNWIRKDQNMFVILKSLRDSKNIKLKINEIKAHHKFYGITQDPKTKDYMVVLNDICDKCQIVCNMIHFQHDFKNWTSGGFGKVYKANWIDGHMDEWDNENQNWKRKGQNMFVALKVLNDSKNVTSEFMDEIALHYKVNSCINIIKLYGLSQDPVTKNYIMVMAYAKNGSLRNYLDTNYNKLDWNYKFGYLQYLAFGLEHIHKNDLIHRDLHSGNVLVLSYAKITDLGLCKPANYTISDNTKNNVYGILSYVAPEILRGQSYTKASDIYSLGIIMYEIISGLPPYHDKSHNENLAIKICKGLRPSFNIKVPQSIVYLIKRCLDADPLNRPMIEEIKEIMSQWRYGSNEKLQRQIKKAEEINNKLPADIIPSTNLGISYKTHSEAIYTSRLLNYDSLPEPKNSDDYYKQNDNIISKEFLESLEINISQLEINNNNHSEPKIISTVSSASLSQQIDISQLNIKNENF